MLCNQNHFIGTFAQNISPIRILHQGNLYSHCPLFLIFPVPLSLARIHNKVKKSGVLQTFVNKHLLKVSWCLVADVGWLVQFTGVPLVIESLSWEHGVMVGAAVKSETTSAAEFKGRQCTLLVLICYINRKHYNNCSILLVMNFVIF